MIRCLTTKRSVRHSSAARRGSDVRGPPIEWTVFKLQVEEESQHEWTDRSDRHDPGILEELGSSLRREKEEQFGRSTKSRQKESGDESRRA